MVNTLFTRDVPVMAMEDGLATSAILKRKRGFDKSFHSAFVATVLAQFYTELEMYSDANALLSSSTLITFEELKSKRQFLTIHGKKVLDEIYNIFLKLRLDNKGVMARC
jgi:hypothetical protein